MDLGLPPKFGRWYPHQLDAAIFAACSPARVTVIGMPPGTGKSAAYMSIRALTGARMMILTMSRGLQDQLMGDFAQIGLVEVRGQNNYRCLYFEDERTCDEGPCHAGVDCSLKSQGCEYYDAVRLAARSPVVVTNYSYWMHMNKYAEPGSLGKFDILVMDEAHEAADALADFLRIKIVRRDIHKLLGIETPPRNVDLAGWVEWALEALPRCRARLEAARTQSILTGSGLTLARRLGGLAAQLDDLARANEWRRTDVPGAPWIPGGSTDWVIEDTGEAATFQPVWAAAYAGKYLFGEASRIVMFSATITPKDARYLGVSDFVYKDFPSPFRVASRPLIVVPAARVGRDMAVGEKKLWLNRIDEIVRLEAFGRNLKGIIHAISYDRARYIYENSRHRDIMMLHSRHALGDAVRTFKSARPPVVLLSPAVGVGFDFPHDETRFQIIAKIPFIDHRSAVIQARARSDPDYLAYVAMTSLIQIVGRGVRSQTDWCRTYLVDDNFAWFYRRVRHLMPQWFRAAIRRQSSVAA